MFATMLPKLTVFESRKAGGYISHMKDSQDRQISSSMELEGSIMKEGSRASRESFCCGHFL